MTGQPDEAREVVVAVSEAGEVAVLRDPPAADALESSIDLEGGSLSFDVRHLAAPPSATLHDPLAAGGWVVLAFGAGVAQAAWHTAVGDRVTRTCAPGPVTSSLARYALLRWLAAWGTGRLDPHALAAETAVVLDELEGIHDDDPDAAADLARTAGPLVDDLLAGLGRSDAHPSLTPFRSLLLKAARLRPADPEDHASPGDPMPTADAGPAPVPPEGAHRGSSPVDRALVAPGLVADGDRVDWAAASDRIWVSVPAADGDDTADRVHRTGGLHARAYASGLSFPVAFVPLRLVGDAFVGEGPLLAIGDPAELEIDLVSGDRTAPPATPARAIPDAERMLLDERMARARAGAGNETDPGRPTLAEALAAIEQEEAMAERFATALVGDAFDDARWAWHLEFSLLAPDELVHRATATHTRTRQVDIEDPALVEALLGHPPAVGEPPPVLELTVQDADDGLRLTLRIAGVTAPRPPALAATVTWPGGQVTAELEVDAGTYVRMLVAEARLAGAEPQHRLAVSIRRLRRP